jgi:endoglucanase
MKAIVLFVVALVSFVATAQSPRVLVKGNQFVTDTGEVILFHGLDTSDPNKLSSEGRWNKRYFEEMKSWGANLVRFPVHPVHWRTLGEAEYVKLLDQGMAWAAELNLYVIIDWHSIGNLREEKFQNPMYNTTWQETRDFWSAMATRYNGNNTVAFFELFNEPTVASGKMGTCTWDQWKEMMEKLIAEIRTKNTTAIPLVAGFNWAYDLSEMESNPIAAEGIAYVSHPYPMKREKPWEEKWTKDWGFAAKKYPLILTEIGFCGKDDRGAHVPVISDESYGDAIMAYCDKNKISYCVWVFDPQWSPMLISDWNFTPTRQGRYFKKVMRATRE